MEYVFGTKDEIEVLKTKGAAHTNLTGYQQTVREFPGEKITDNFRIARKISSSEDSEGNCYDWYEIDHHYREIDRTGPITESLNNAAQVSGIAFVVMAERGDIDEVTARHFADKKNPFTSLSEGQGSREKKLCKVLRKNLYYYLAVERKLC